MGAALGRFREQRRLLRDGGAIPKMLNQAVPQSYFFTLNKTLCAWCMELGGGFKFSLK